MTYLRNPPGAQQLREQAKSRLLLRGFGVRTMTPLKLQHLLEELEVHQIELEIQNEHLNAARAQLEAALNQSSELFDFSPVGSVSMDEAGSITMLNLSAARLLGGERARLLGSKLGLYVAEADRSVFNGLLTGASTSGDVQSAEIALTIQGSLAQFVNMRVSPYHPEQGWQVVLIDINERRRHEQQLRASEAIWKLALDATGDGVWDWNVQSGEVIFSRRFEQLYGFGAGEYGNCVESWSERVHPDDKARVFADMRAYLEGATESYRSEYRCLCKDGSWKWVLSRSSIVGRTPEGRPLRLVGTHVDISGRKKIEEALVGAVRSQQAVFDSLDAHIAVLDLDGTIVQTNSAWQEYAIAAGCADSASLAGGKYLEILAVLADQESQTMQAAAAGLASVLSGAATTFKLAQPFFVPRDRCWLSMKVRAVSDAEDRIVVSHENVSSFKASELASLQLANTDALTGALSRRNFLHLAEQELARSTRYDLPLVVLMLDLDHFKLVNDRFGHAVGDVVLKSFVLTVRSVLRDSDLIGRLGGEEFAVLLPNTNLEGGRALAQRIVEIVRASPVPGGERQVAYTVSIGVACFSDQRSFDALLGLADAALYRAKDQGRDRIEVLAAVADRQASGEGSGDGVIPAT